jgi:hypothetical protein
MSLSHFRAVLRPGHAGERKNGTPKLACARKLKQMLFTYPCCKKLIESNNLSKKIDVTFFFSPACRSFATKQEKNLRHNKHRTETGVESFIYLYVINVM